MEYIKLSDSQKIYGEKTLLQSEIEILQIIKRIRLHKKLRKLKHELKIELRKKIKEILEEIEILEKNLPRTKGIEKKLEKAEKSIERKKRKDIEYEISEIQKRLAKLNG